MFKWIKWGLCFIMGALLLGLTCLIGIMHWANQQVATVTLDNGQVYTYHEYGADTSYRIGDVNVYSATLQQILDVLGSDDAIPSAAGEIVDAKQAAYVGATALNQVFSVWTWNNQTAVCFNETANVWIAHGMLEDRLSDDKLGVVVLDAFTGEVLAAELMKPNIN